MLISFTDFSIQFNTKYLFFIYLQINNSPVSLPIILRHNVLLRERGGRLDVVVVPKTMGKPVSKNLHVDLCKK